MEGCGQTATHVFFRKEEGGGNWMPVPLPNVNKCRLYAHEYKVYLKVLYRGCHFQHFNSAWDSEGGLRLSFLCVAWRGQLPCSCGGRFPHCRWAWAVGGDYPCIIIKNVVWGCLLWVNISNAPSDFTAVIVSFFMNATAIVAYLFRTVEVWNVHLTLGEKNWQLDLNEP